MNLREWRKAQTPKMTLAAAAPLFGLSISALAEMERGETIVSCETLARAQGVTGGLVQPRDVIDTYFRTNRPSLSEHRAAGRSAMAAYRKTAKKPRK